MDRAASFAEAVAALVNAYEKAKLFRDLGERVLAGSSGDDVNAVREWLSGLRESAEHREMMDLAILVREIANRGEAERVMCKDLLESIMRYSDSKTETSFLSL
jgi:hypothetical protein